MLTSSHQGGQLGLFFFPLPLKSIAQRFERATLSFFLSCSLLVPPPTHPPTHPPSSNQSTQKALRGNFKEHARVREHPVCGGWVGRWRIHDNENANPHNPPTHPLSA